jgi:hypothetical protein
MRPRPSSCPWTHQMIRPHYFISAPLTIAYRHLAGNLEKNYEVLMDVCPTEGAPPTRMFVQRTLAGVVWRNQRVAAR